VEAPHLLIKYLRYFPPKKFYTLWCLWSFMGAPLDSRVGPCYVPALSGFFSEGWCFPAFAHHFHYSNRFRNQRPTLRFVDLQEFKFEIATYDSETPPERRHIVSLSPGGGSDEILAEQMRKAS
jgi:hypothetical protein